MNDILCTTDLTAASDAALRHALVLADRLGDRVSLLHVASKAEHLQAERVKEAMLAQVEQAGADAGRVRLMITEGDFMSGIVQESAHGHRLLVMGTHGPHGLRQSFFGADILKLVRRSAIPSFVVQAGSATDGELNRIVMPVAGHDDIGRLIDQVCDLAKAFAAEVHIFQLVRPGEQPSDRLLANKLRMVERFGQEGIRHIEANVPSTAFSVGFAQCTIDYAQRIGAGAIAIMGHASDEYRYIADAEKERLLANAPQIPVLCA
jgi:nucleotide-binding universal stress UspA family protein